MREKVRDRGRLEHILEAIESIEEFHAQYTFEDIKKNKLIFYGFTKLVEVIGEAVYMLSTEFRDSHSDVNWRQIERMRHVLVHGYYTIDPESLWDTIEVDIPELKPWIVKYLSEKLKKLIFFAVPRRSHPAQPGETFDWSANPIA